MLTLTRAELVLLMWCLRTRATRISVSCWAVSHPPASLFSLLWMTGCNYAVVKMPSPTLQQIRSCSPRHLSAVITPPRLHRASTDFGFQSVPLNTLHKGYFTQAVWEKKDLWIKLYSHHICLALRLFPALWFWWMNNGALGHRQGLRRIYNKNKET